MAGVLRGAFGRRVFVVPLFISEGYFTQEIIPRELGLARSGHTDFPRTQQLGGRMLHYCGPVGTHASMTEVILARAAQVIADHSPKLAEPPCPAETSLFIAGHGTGGNENSRLAIERQVDLISARALYATTQAIFMEEEPLIASCYSLATTRDVVVVPFFISEGLHSREDIPVMLGETAATVRECLATGLPTFVNPTERRGRRVWYARSIGDEPSLADVILERVRDSAAAAAPLVRPS